MKTKKQYIPAEHRNIRPGIKMKPRYITIHNTGNTDQGADADAHARLLKKGNNRQASWHFSVDDKKVVQHLPTDEVGWHAGDGRGSGNMSSIGVEICENRDGDFAQAEANTAQLVRRLCDELDIPVSRVVPHRHWSGKNCPHRTLRHWGQFIEMVKKAPQKPDNPFDQFQPEELSPAPNGAGFTRTLKNTRPQMKGKDVLAVQEFLGVKPWKDQEGRKVGIFGPITEKKLKAWQKQNGIKVTGEVGDYNWFRMFGRVEDGSSDQSRWIRVKQDGKQIGAFQNPDNAIRLLTKILRKGDTIQVKQEK
ncbi:peptidoglycan recognition protein family protein [Melghirimyces algeriensis]|uniref:N-acetylmuramoyl-L-alanine amidase n=1 Tax=Melghirimyces algeriensis TaxID=910412 RepID=A0A521BN40_9BACL|nr:N-acetylmuramoyl-L-alanine amidase [Melghirimyces algeriensis]SMO48564.1 N-acetylmuramoyl-L-alanine amidase [Melghirimyces algeriensis]